MKLDPRKTAVLTLDLQKGIFEMIPTAETVIPTAARVVNFARQTNMHLLHVGLGFAAGYPEIADNAGMARVKQMNRFLIGTPSAEFHPEIYRAGDLIVYKHRVGGFSENQLHLILRAQGIENLVLFGIATSGITLSTLRRAYDLDYRCTVIKDACTDRDEEVHRVLTEKVFPNQANVLTADAFIAEQSPSG